MWFHCSTEVGVKYSILISIHEFPSQMDQKISFYSNRIMAQWDVQIKHSCHPGGGHCTGMNQLRICCKFNRLI